jgi:hypothetical protein
MKNARKFRGGLRSIYTKHVVACKLAKGIVPALQSKQMAMVRELAPASGRQARREMAWRAFQI